MLKLGYLLMFHGNIKNISLIYSSATDFWIYLTGDD